MQQQLVYGSADQIAGRSVGGWGVLHASAPLTPDIQRRLLALTSVSMPAVLPQFPSAGQLAARTVRFRVDPGPDASAACRSIEAGTDHTGRPGNVVSHCALIAPVAEARPVDWYFSPGWVSPYGPRQIADAVPPSELPVPGGWDDTARWLRDDPSRIARIRWIVDAACALLGEGGIGRILLISPSAQEAARWASLVSWLLHPDAAGRMRIRIGEDARSAVEQLATPPVLVSVTDPLDPSTIRGLPQLDVTWQLDAAVANASGKWELPGGGSVPVTEFSGLVTDLVYADPVIARAVFAKRDELVTRHLSAGHPASAAPQLLLLQAAWLSTPGAQELARVDPIRHLLDALTDEQRGWDEIVALASETGGDVDVYAMPPEPVDPWHVDEEPAGVEAAVIAAARLGAEGVDIETMLASGRFVEIIEHQPEHQRQALREIAAALDLPDIHREES